MPIQTWSDFFRANYYENTYLPPVDLSEEALAPHLLSATEPEVAAIAQQLVSQEGVRQALTEPVDTDLKINFDRNEILTNHGFELKSTVMTSDNQTVPTYQRINHPDLLNRSIFTTARRTAPGTFVEGYNAKTAEPIYITKKQGILTFALHRRISEIAQESHIPIFTLAPKLVPYANSNSQSDITKKYCIIGNAADLLPSEETNARIESFTPDAQRILATSIATLIKKAGLLFDGFQGIKLTTDNQLYLQTEPVSHLMVAKKTGFWNSLFQKKGASLEACARISLSTLLEATKVKQSTPIGILGQDIKTIVNPKLQAFHDVIAQEYAQALNPKLSSAQIAFSILSFGLLPLIYACKAAFESFKLKQLNNELIQINRKYPGLFCGEGSIHYPTSEAQKTEMLNAYLHKVSPIRKRRAALLQGVPHLTHT